MIFINGKYPGPLLEIQQDDWVEVEVHNALPFDTTIHFHGIHQMNTPWADGTPGLSQRPIASGASYKYRWHADSYGSYFYHAHSRGQIDDGAYGPVIVRPKAGIPKPFNVIASNDIELLEEAEASARPLILTDWRHKTSESTWSDQIASGLESAICMDSLLVNGKGAVSCWSREEIDASVDQAIMPLLKDNNLLLTNKGCVPPKFFTVTLGSSQDINTPALPPEVFDICTPTKGSREIIETPRDKKWFSMHVISTAGIDTFAFSIDEHPMWVYAVDAHYIEPMKVDVLTVANGDRYSVFVKLDKGNGDYGIRVTSKAATQVIDTTAILSYSSRTSRKARKNSGLQERQFTNNTTGDAPFHNDTKIVSSKPSINRIGEAIGSNITVFDQAKMISFPPQFPQPAPPANQTYLLHMHTSQNSYTWALNSTPMYQDTMDQKLPLLWQKPDTNITSGNLTITTKNNTWVDLILINDELLAPPHPIHKHSNKVFILGSGEGEFKWTSVKEAAAAIPQNFNLVTPPFRDGFVVPASGQKPTWLAVRYHVVNPGAFMLHCHIQSHLNGGMAMVILDGVDAWPETPDEYKN
ncbi:hypothetical protein CC86DRAFT_378617 [Ophiobolus disseminans]|uniref:Multicopper oxidase n=1 Tax=Ophiobolus disseminans TaxID=1469910 RepID=A0A6A7ABR3_9PLEO|nr:hypothetical protein CC86DRAFT_378617 [Ophiobolus disseminans]